MNLNPISMGAAPLVAAALGRVLGIKVEMSHTARTAMTDRKRIILPYLPVTLPEQIAKIVWGFIHHEAGHCRHTDFDVRIDNHKELAADKLLDHLLRILEDIRMERAHIRFYPGAARTLAELVEALVAIGFFKPLPQDADVNYAFNDFVLKHLRSTMLGQVALCDQVKLSRAALEQHLGPGFVTRLVAELQPILTANNTTDALNLAHRIRRFLQDELDAQQSPPPPPQGGKGQSQPDDSSGVSQQPSSGGDSDQDDDEQGGDTTSSTAASNDSQDEDSDAAKSASSSQDDDEQGGDTTSSTAASDDSQEEDSDAAESASSSQGDEDNTAAEALKSILSGGDVDDSLGDLGDALSDVLQDSIDEQASSPVSLPEDDRRKDGYRDRNAIAKARSVTSRLAIQLKRQLESHADVISEPKQRGKRLSRRHLMRVAFKDYRVFQHKELLPEVNTAVVSLIDVSGSMSNRVSGSSTRLVDIASEAILATSLALATIPRLAHAVGAFPSHRGDDYIELVQDFPERVEPISSRFDLSPRGSTPMAEALLWAANRLLQREEERRIIFVATDGHPDDVTTTKEILVHLRKLGIEIHGIGIRSDDRYSLFDSFASIEDVGTLPKAFLSLFQRLLKRTA